MHFGSFISVLVLQSMLASVGCEDISPSSAPDDDDNQTCEENYGGTNVILVLFCMLLPGLLARYALRPVPIPYTALLLLFGSILGLLQVQLTGGVRNPLLQSEEKGSSAASPSVAPSSGDGGLEENQIQLQGHDHWRNFADGIDAWQSIDPELLLLVFVPALIFSTAFSLDFHITRRSFGQVMLLAGPGMCISMILTSFFVKYVFPYGWCWPKALMFGAMVSATDPVAVVSLLKQVGTSRHLGTVIETESLFNSETSLIFFFLFKDMIPVTEDCLNDKMNCCHEKEPYCEDDKFVPRGCILNRNLGESIALFFKLGLGGPALGVLSGFLTTFWIQYIYNDLLTEILVTFVSAYLTFFVAETHIKESGALAVITLGLFMGYFAKTRISPKVHEPLRAFWEIMEYLSNTLIFVFGGLKIAMELFERTQGQGKWIRPAEWGYAFLLYTALQLIRLFTVFLLLPLLNKMGYGMTWKDAVVITWSGLRGAVGLALALIVKLDDDNIPPSFRGYTIFYLCFIIVATVLLNGTTMPYLLKLLEIAHSNPEKLQILSHLVAEMEAVGKRSVMDCSNDILGVADQTKILELTELRLEKVVLKQREGTNSPPALNQIKATSKFHWQIGFAKKGISKIDDDDEILPISGPPMRQIKTLDRAKKVWGSFKRRMTQSLARDLLGPKHPAQKQITQDLVLQDLRYRLLLRTKTAYGEWLDKGYVTATAMLDLIESTDASIDHLDQPIRDWYYLKRVVTPPQWRRNLQEWKGTFGRGYLGDFIDQFLSSLLWRSLMDGVLLTRAFMMAHTEAEHTLQEYISKRTRSEEVMQNSTEMEMLEEAVTIVIKESQAVKSEASKMFQDFRHSYPEILRAIKTRLRAMEILLIKQKSVEDQQRAGTIENREAILIKDMIDTKLKHICYHSFTLNLPDSKVLLSCHPLFAALSKSTIDEQVVPFAKPKALKEKDRIFTKGEESQFITIIIRGQVKMIVNEGKETFVGDGLGSVIGVAEVLLDQRKLSTMVCETMTEIYQIDRNYFLEVLMKDSTIWTRAWQIAGMMMTYVDPWGIFFEKSINDLCVPFKFAEVLEFEQGSTMTIDSLAYLVKGIMGETILGQIEDLFIVGPSPLGPRVMFYKALTNATVLKLPEDFSWSAGLSRTFTPTVVSSMSRKSSQQQYPSIRFNSSSRPRAFDFNPIYKQVSIEASTETFKRSSSDGPLFSTILTQKDSMDRVYSADLETRKIPKFSTKRFNRKVTIRSYDPLA